MWLLCCPAPSSGTAVLSVHPLEGKKDAEPVILYERLGNGLRTRGYMYRFELLQVPVSLKLIDLKHVTD